MDLTIIGTLKQMLSFVSCLKLTSITMEKCLGTIMYTF